MVDNIKDFLKTLAEDARVDSIQLTSNNRFWMFAQSLNAQKLSSGQLRDHFSKPVLALDPGETTGVALWWPKDLTIFLLQLTTKEVPEGFDKILSILTQTYWKTESGPGIMHCRYEDYRVYGHMTETHSFSHLHTPRMIGAIEVACHLAHVPSSCCLAMHAKTFWTDEKLKLCSLYNRGLKHARDAQRHLLRYMGE